eukprot:7133490-Heterocapsa_arctica.AAC.1
MEAKFGVRFAELEAKLAKMMIHGGEDFIGPPAKKRNMGAVSSQSNASTRGPASASPTSSPLDNLNDARRVWVVGFGRKLMKKELDKKAHEVLNKVLATHEASRAMIDGKNLKE